MTPVPAPAVSLRQGGSGPACLCPPCWGGLCPPPRCPVHGQGPIMQVTYR